LLRAFPLLPIAANLLEKRYPRINSVDGLHTVLEILSRSSYVPSITLGV
jgi:hypothetical protein